MLICETSVSDRRTRPFYTSQKRIRSFKSVDFPLPLRAHDAHNAALREANGHVGENVLPAIGERDVLGLRAGERNIRLAGDFVRHWLLIQNVEHAVACGEGVLQRRAEIRQRHRGAEGGEQREDRDERAVERQFPALHQRLLSRPQRGVGAALFQKRVVRAVLDDIASVKHVNFSRRRDVRQAVRDEQHRLAPGEGVGSGP